MIQTGEVCHKQTLLDKELLIKETGYNLLDSNEYL